MSEVENVIPVFPVRVLCASIAFYAQLGFAVDWQDGQIGSVSRDGHSIMLAEASEAGSPGVAWIGLQTDALIQTVLSLDLTVVQKPRNDAFAYHMKIADPDGNVLWLGTGPKAEA